MKQRVAIMTNLNLKRKIQLAVVFLFLPLLPIIAYASQFGPDFGYTGAPGDNGNCTSCHAGNVGSGPGSVGLATTRRRKYSGDLYSGAPFGMGLTDPAFSGLNPGRTDVASGSFPHGPGFGARGLLTSWVLSASGNRSARPCLCVARRPPLPKPCYLRRPNDSAHETG